MADRRTVTAAARVSLSALLRQAMARTRTWTAPATEVERERTRELARIGANLNHWLQMEMPNTNEGPHVERQQSGRIAARAVGDA